MKQLIKQVYYSLYNVFLDSHLDVQGTPNMGFLERLKISWKHRIAASTNITLSENERRFASLKNKHAGKRCFIIGNGPSLNKVDLTLLKNEFTMGVNAIYTNYENMGFHPNYYVVEDIFVAEDRQHEINAFKGPAKFFGNYLKYCIKPAEDVIWLNVRFKYEDREALPNFSTNALRQVWVGGTVSYINLQLAYYLGFKEVYLVGFDHNYDIPKDVKVEGTEILSLGDDVNHFNKDYFGKGKRWHDPMVDRMEKSYLQADRYFKADGRRVYNATVGGKLEVFKRIDYDKLF